MSLFLKLVVCVNILSVLASHGGMNSPSNELMEHYLNSAQCSDTRDHGCHSIEVEIQTQKQVTKVEVQQG
jgi:hypothetical protein